jgi:hypothetical protein
LVRSKSVPRIKSAETDLIVRDGDRVVNDVADDPDFGLEKLLLLGGRGKQVLLLLLKSS